MKKPPFFWAVPLGLVLSCLLSAPARAQVTSFTATGWVNQVLAPGIVCADTLGQVRVRGSVHTARVQSPDPRVTGQAFIITDGGFNADGTANIQGPVYLQVGTWDAAGTNFTPSGPMWEATWRGVMQTNYSLQLNVAGYGVGGSIDGMRLETTLTREPAAGLYDTNSPYHYAGTIKPAPVSTNLFFDGFTNGLQWTELLGGGTATMNTVGEQLVTHEDWTGVPGPDAWFYAYAPPGPWSVADGQTVDCQADLISLSQNATNVAFVWIGNSSVWYQFNYECGKGPKTVSLFKATDSSLTIFWVTNTVQLPSTNVALAMALTRDKANLIITTRVLDKNNQNAVVFECSFVDGPGVDPSLTAAQFIALTGWITSVPHGAGQPDPGPPIFSGTLKGLGVMQVTDGHQPPVDAIWDNFSLGLHDVPPLGIARAAQLTWPAPTGVNYTVEAAPNLQAPWLPVQDQTSPGMSQMTVPASDPMRFFRLVQAP